MTTQQQTKDPPSIWIIVTKIEGEDRYDDSEFVVEPLYYLTEKEAEEDLERMYETSWSSSRSEERSIVRLEGKHT
jgi:hypothetical protein